MYVYIYIERERESSCDGFVFDRRPRCSTARDMFGSVCFATLIMAIAWNTIPCRLDRHRLRPLSCSRDGVLISTLFQVAPCDMGGSHLIHDSEVSGSCSRVLDDCSKGQNMFAVDITSFWMTRCAADEERTTCNCQSV